MKNIACGMTHSGAISEQGNVYVWGMSGCPNLSREHKDKFLFKMPTKISFAGDSSLDKRRRSTMGEEPASVVIDDIKMGEYFTIVLSNRG